MSDNCIILEDLSYSKKYIAYKSNQLPGDLLTTDKFLFVLEDQIEDDYRTRIYNIIEEECSGKPEEFDDFYNLVREKNIKK